MYLWESDIQESVVFKPIEIRGKRGRKKLKKSNVAIYIPNMDADNFEKICNENGLKFVYVEVPPHGDLIDRTEAIVDANERAYDFWSSDAETDATVKFLQEQVSVIPAELLNEEANE